MINLHRHHILLSMGHRHDRSYFLSPVQEDLHKLYHEYDKAEHCKRLYPRIGWYLDPENTQWYIHHILYL